jgi:hypothetical protein
MQYLFKDGVAIYLYDKDITLKTNPFIKTFFQQFSINNLI